MSISPKKLSPDRPDLWQLADKLVEGRLTLDERDRLDALLRSDEQSKLFLAAYIDLHACMLWRFREQRLHPSSGDGSGDASGTSSRSPILGFLGDTIQQGIGFLTSQSHLPVLVAGLVIGGLLAGLAVWTAPLYFDDSPQREPAVGTTYVARLTRCADCRWADEQSHPLPLGEGRGEGAPLLGQFLKAGRRLELVAGLAEIKFDSGTVIILEGPARFEPETENGGLLHAGSLAADVPDDAVGFTVRTPRLSVVDLGTQFGMCVDADGAAEVHVFAGAVEVGRNGQQQKVRLQANESARFDTRGVQTDQETADRERFTRAMPKRPARVRFFTNESAWLAKVGRVETLRTIASSVALADEVAGPPARNQDLGPVLTFQGAKTGLARGFRLTILQPGSGPGHGFVFEDTSGNAKMPPAFVNALAVGKGDKFEDDDWKLEITSGPQLLAFAVDLCDNAPSASEILAVYGPSGKLLGSTKAVPGGASGTVGFLGVVSDKPITKITFNEDPEDDDTAIANFRFPRANRR